MEQIINRKILNINTQDMNSKTALMLGKYFRKLFPKKSIIILSHRTRLEKLIACSK
jgi:hypothetical protein